MKTITLVVAVTGVTVIVLGLSIRSEERTVSESDYESIRQYVIENDEELEAAVSAFIEKQDQGQSRTHLKYHPHNIDSNGNVYFIVDWNTFATVGFVFRSGDSVILGDGSEPNVKDQRHIVGDWWYYLAN